MKAIMRILSVLRVVGRQVGRIAGRTAVEVVTSGDPMLVSLVRVAFRAVVNAEAAFGPKKGQDKLEHALSSMDAALPALVEVAEQRTGRDIDEKQLAAGIKELLEALVKIAHSVGIFAKG